MSSATRDNSTSSSVIWMSFISFFLNNCSKISSTALAEVTRVGILLTYFLDLREKLEVCHI